MYSSPRSETLVPTRDDLIVYRRPVLHRMHYDGLVANECFLNRCGRSGSNLLVLSSTAHLPHIYHTAQYLFFPLKAHGVPIRFDFL
eukprot:1195788-Prorocentrum_minimum.AAC.5